MIKDEICLKTDKTILIPPTLSGSIKPRITRAIHIWVSLPETLFFTTVKGNQLEKKKGGQRIHRHMWTEVMNHYWH